MPKNTKSNKESELLDHPDSTQLEHTIHQQKQVASIDGQAAPFDVITDTTSLDEQETPFDADGERKL